MKEHVSLYVYTHIYIHILVYVYVLVNGDQSPWELEKTDDVLAASNVTSSKL